MADYSLLAQALEQEDKRAQSSNPWTTAGSIIGSAKIGQAARSPWEGIAAAVMQGMLSGGLSGYGQQQVQNDKADFSRRWADALNTSDPTAAFAQDEKLAPYAQEMRLTQLAQDQDRKDSRYKSLVDAITKDAAQTGDFSKVDAIKADGTIDLNSLKRGPQSPDFGDNGPALGPIADKRIGYFNKFRQSGLDPIRAAKAAGEMTAAETKANAATYTDEATARKSAETLRGLSDKIQAAIDSPVYTGTGGSWNQLGNRMIASTPFASDETKAKAAAGGVFENIIPEVVGMGRPPGVRLTQNEWNALVSAKPSISKSKAENQTLNNLWKTAADQQSRYADLLATVREAGGTQSEANRIWDMYTARQPLFANGPDGGVIANPNRGDWADIWQPGQNFPSSVAPAAMAQSATGSFFGSQSPATQDIPPGMKLQRNPKTGETRIVPQ